MRALALVGVMLAVEPVLAASGNMSGGVSGVVGNAFFSNAPPQRMVLVEKKAGKAYLVRNRNDRPHVVRRYNRILLGENGGDKIAEGDKRTPEGVYYIQSFIPPGELGDIYGDGAFPLNYPNIVDRIEDRTGYGIWLHGIDEEADDKVATKGCVAFNNASLNGLKGRIDIGTPVVITRDAEFLSPEEYQSRRERFLGRLRGFLRAWETGDFPAFRDYLHPAFRNSAGQDAETYLAEKKHLMETYAPRQVDAEHVRVYKENGHRVVYDFDQFYCAPNIAAYGRKRLYFASAGEGPPRLIAEEYFRKRVWPEIYQRIRSFVDGWREAWESEKLEAYMDHYARDFTHHGRDRGQWRAYKKGVFARREEMRVAIENLWIRRLAANRYVVGFDQRFSSREYQDYGVKTLVLSGCPGALHIDAEYWRPLP